MNKRKYKNIIVFVFCIVSFLALQILLTMAVRNGKSMLNGIFTACQFAICLIMIVYDNRKGIKASLTLMSFVLINVLFSFAVSRNVSSVAGIFNAGVYIIILIVLAGMFRKREQDAITDFLTGFRNRRGLYELLSEKAESENPFCILYLDIGNFKMINDNFGHTYGDLLLKETSSRMKEVVGAKGIVTRFGGDEFVVILDDIQSIDSVADALLTRITERYSIKNRDAEIECEVTAHIGISHYPDDTRDCAELLKFADIAMYHAAREKHSCIRHFDKEMEQFLKRSVELETLIKKALKEDYFYLVYQPQFRIDGKKLRGFETLLRLKTPEG